MRGKIIEMSADKKAMLKRNADDLRRNMTLAERRLWWHLGNAFPDHRFLPQVVVGRYIVDFLQPERKIIIEADGGQHADSLSDKIRDFYLRLRGYKVIRFWNNDIMGNIEGCLIQVKNAL